MDFIEASVFSIIIALSLTQPWLILSGCWNAGARTNFLRRLTLPFGTFTSIFPFSVFFTCRHLIFKFLAFCLPMTYSNSIYYECKEKLRVIFLLISSNTRFDVYWEQVWCVSRHNDVPAHASNIDRTLSGLADQHAAAGTRCSPAPEHPVVYYSEWMQVSVQHRRKTTSQMNLNLL